MVSWVKAFLEDRKEKVRVDDGYSRVKQIKEGLPQGSVMAPVLFFAVRK